MLVEAATQKKESENSIVLAYEGGRGGGCGLFLIFPRHSNSVSGGNITPNNLKVGCLHPVARFGVSV
jgi:hypothetical protein